MVDLKCGFYNAVMVDGLPDRTYNAEEVNDFLEGLVSKNGVFATVSTACQVVPSAGLQFVVKAGKGMVDNHWFKIESDVTLEVEPADVVLNRIDSVIVKHNNTDRKITLEIKKGTLATNPVAPTLTRTEDVYEICLANILVNKNIETITTSLISDTRPNNDVCGWITGLINQMDTTTLFEQYEAAQNDFITEKTTEYEAWEGNQQNNFDTWFNDIKDDVKATSLYREYQDVYTTQKENEQIIPIPTSIQYNNNGLDVLNVYISGMRLLQDIEYTINSNGTSIILTTGLDVIGTDVEFVNKKSIDGAVAENVVLQVEQLQEDVNQLKTNVDDLTNSSYLATGTNDNVTLSNMVKDFLNGTGDYLGVADNTSMKIDVFGTLGINNLISDQMIFDFNSSVSSNRKVVVDFGNATIPTISKQVTSILAVFSATDQVTIQNANIKMGSCSFTTLYIFHGGIVRYCEVNCTESLGGQVYGMWGGKEISNSKIDIIISSTGAGVYSTTKVVLNEIKINNKKGTADSINATDGNILIGNIVDGAIEKTSGVVELGTVTE